MIDNEQKNEVQETLSYFIPHSVNWHKYNLAKTNEKRFFYKLLHELTLVIPEEKYVFGRPPISIRDLFFCAGLKLYSNYAGRKASSDFVHAELAGYIHKAPHFNTLTDFFNCPATYDLLQKMLTISAIPLSHLEDCFAMDSSGFGNYNYTHIEEVRKPFTVRSTKSGKKRQFIKGHIVIGTRTNVICACEITDRFVSDVSQGEKLVFKAGEHFKIKEMSADKAYSSKRIHQAIEGLGALPFIPFRENANPSQDSPSIWIRMHRYFLTNKEWFKKHYHRRSNVESTFAMIKVRLGEFLRCKNDESQRNELMMKFICHNVSCLVAEMFENDIHVDFRKALEYTLKAQGKGIE